MPYPDPSLIPKQKTLTRRNFLWVLVGGIGALISAIIGIPLAGFLASPALRKETEPLTPVAFLADIPTTEPYKVSYTSVKKDAWLQTIAKKTVYVVKKSDADVTVFSTVCTHLGCAVHWDETKKEFLCPCHGGVYDGEGKVLSGPPPRPLDRLFVKIDNGQIFVQETYA
jgi:menaquinol-cytochrome c reductase iron-sulfur subunit